jgi:predicted O-methyltransferase YrrM
MPQNTPEEIDPFIAQLFAHQHDSSHYESALAEMQAASLPEINVSASEGMTLHVLIRAVAAKRVLEIGTLGGYSALWLASALPANGKLITLELDPKHAAVATANILKAGLSDRVEVRVGPATESLAALERDGIGGFDVTFIDANKDGYVDYLDYAIRLTRVGGVILSDNTLTHSALDPTADTGITRFNRKLAHTPGLISAVIPTLRHGIDGLSISVVVHK